MAEPRRVADTAVIPLLLMLGCCLLCRVNETAAEPPSPPLPVEQPGDADDQQGAVEEFLPRSVLAWGVTGVRLYAIGQQAAPNGLEFMPIFSLDMNFNCWIQEPLRLYLFADSRFWGQKASAGVTNSSQGWFDFSKREMDIDLGIAWNPAGPWEVRAFAYSFNNLNRGTSLSAPSGYADGVGLESRYYLGETYTSLGTVDFDIARATFLSLGYYPTKDLVGGDGQTFKPGPFARAYLTLDLLAWCYVFVDAQTTATSTFSPKLLQTDAGLALRPFAAVPSVEFRLGTESTYDLQNHDLDIGVYGSIRLIF
jgi:hypothetical protein